MLKTPKYVVSLFAFAVVFPLATSAVSIAGSTKFAESGKGTQKGPTIRLDKTSPKKQPTHSMGVVRDINPAVGRLRGPEVRESGMGRLAGEIRGDKHTPKRTPTFGAMPR